MVATTQEIVYAFMQTYYQRMKENPTKLANLYSNTAELTHVNYNQITTINHEDNSKFSILPTIKLIGKENINKFFTRHSDKVQNLKVKVDTCDFQSTDIAHRSILIVITGELFWINTKTHHYLQTFILTPVSKNSDIYDISNDVIRFIPNKSHKHEQILVVQKEDIEDVIRKDEILENNKEREIKENGKDANKEKENVTNNDNIKKIKAPKIPIVDDENIRSNSPTPTENVSQHVGDHKRTSSKHHKKSDSIITKKDNIINNTNQEHEKAKNITTTITNTSSEMANIEPEKEVKKENDFKQNEAKSVAIDNQIVANEVNDKQSNDNVENNKAIQIKSEITESNSKSVNTDTTTKSTSPTLPPASATVTAAPVKMSWASKLSSFEPNKKIVVNKPSMGTTAVETNNSTHLHKKDNNSSNKNKTGTTERKAYDMNNRKDNMSNRKDKKNKLTFSNVNKDGYYPIYINGTFGLTEEDIKTALMKEFGTIMRISVGDNFAVVDFQNQQSQTNAIDKRKLIVKNVEISLERKTMKKNSNSNSNSSGQQQNNNFIKSNKKFNNSMSNNSSRKKEIDNM